MSDRTAGNEAAESNLVATSNKIWVRRSTQRVRAKLNNDKQVEGATSRSNPIKTTGKASRTGGSLLESFLNTVQKSNVYTVAYNSERKFTVD